MEGERASEQRSITYLNQRFTNKKKERSCSINDEPREAHIMYILSFFICGSFWSYNVKFNYRQIFIKNRLLLFHSHFHISNKQLFTIFFFLQNNFSKWKNFFMFLFELFSKLKSHIMTNKKINIENCIRKGTKWPLG